MSRALRERLGRGAARRAEHLPSPDLDAPLARVVAARRSRRELAGRPLGAEELGALLWAGQGTTGPGGLRAAPSAGALYPTTLLVADGRGVWRYAPAPHALEPVAEGDARARLAAAALGQECVALAPATIAVTCRPAVLAPRYGRRSERYCTLEAGHVAQNVLLMATALGLGAVPVGAFDDAAVRAELRLGPEHLVLYLIPVGARG